jgi:tripartite-type tricarboxylate transporter receptor subunit TctC
MTISRRRFGALAACAAVMPAPVARAQSWPSRPVRIVSGYPPGGINDTYARLIGLWLSERLGQSFVVENRTGAGGNLAAEMVVRAPPDGYTLLLATSGDAWNATLYDNLKFNFARDTVPVAAMSRGMGVLVVHPSFPVHSVAELIAYARMAPGKGTVGSAGIGSVPHMFWELFRTLTGVDMLHVPYRGGGPAVIDLLSGQVQVYFGTATATIEYIRDGRLRPLGVTGATPSPALPDVPPIGATVPGYEASFFVGIAAPHGTPADIVERLNAAINLALADARIAARIATLGDTPLPLSPAAFGKLVADETDKWAKVIRTANIRAQ